MLAFAHIDRCGGTTIIEILRRSFFLDHCDVVPRDPDSMLFRAGDMRDLLRLRPTVKSVSGHSIRISSELDDVVPDIRFYTTLRDPIRRYISDYHHFVDRLSFPGGFGQWLEWEDRHNFQTKSIAGCCDVERAKRLLQDRFAMVGVLEEFDVFLDELRWLAWKSLGHHLRTAYRVANVSAQHHRIITGLCEEFGEDISAVNESDLELYDFVRAELLPRQRMGLAARLEDLPQAEGNHGPWIQDLNEKRRLLTYRLYRNCVYKPYMGRWPLRVHRLPAYERFMKRSG